MNLQMTVLLSPTDTLLAAMPCDVVDLQCACHTQGGSLGSNSAGATAFAQLMARMVPALRGSLVEDIKQAAQQAEEVKEGVKAESGS